LCFNELSNVAAIAAGGQANYALKKDGTVWIWSAADLNADTAGKRIFDRAQMMSAGQAHVLLLKDDGSLWAYGDGSAGQLGYGGTGHQLSALQVGGGIVNVVAIAAGARHSLARDEQGMVWSWGDNNNGQLGTGDRNARTTPGPVWDGTGELRGR
jgi:alpha-tubulin suppressor-like RCC1 family protein